MKYEMISNKLGGSLSKGCLLRFCSWQIGLDFFHFSFLKIILPDLGHVATKSLGRAQPTLHHSFAFHSLILRYWASEPTYNNFDEIFSTSRHAAQNGQTRLITPHYCPQTLSAWQHSDKFSLSQSLIFGGKISSIPPSLDWAMICCFRLSDNCRSLENVVTRSVSATNSPIFSLINPLISFAPSFDPLPFYHA